MDSPNRAPRKAWPLAIAGLILTGLLAVALVHLGRRGPRTLPARVNGRAALRISGKGELRAGAGRAQIALDRAGGLSARALVFEAGGVQTIVVALDALLIPGPLEEKVLRAANLPARTCLLLAATHTHSGAGGTWNNLLAEVAGNGVYQARLERAHIDAVAQAIAQAEQQLAPARIRFVQQPTSGLAESRGPGTVDPALTVLRVYGESSGATIATLVDLAMHPTVVRRNRAFVSADWPGEAARAIEQRTSAPALVVQGAGGNATWIRDGMPASPQEAARVLGERVAAQAEEALAGAADANFAAPVQPGKVVAPAEPVALRCTVRLIALPPAQVSPAVPWLLRTAASNGLALFAEPFAVQTTIDLEGLRLEGIPAEVVGDLGPPDNFAKVQNLQNVQGRATALVTLADGYEGYVETPAHWQAGQGEASRTYYGPGLARALLFNALSPPPAAADPRSLPTRPPSEPPR